MKEISEKVYANGVVENVYEL